MAFPVDKRVSCSVMCNNPLINEESHFTASFRSLWFINCNCNLNVETVQLNFSVSSCCGPSNQQMWDWLDFVSGRWQEV